MRDFILAPVAIDSQEFTFLIVQLYPEKLLPFIKSPSKEFLVGTYVLKENEVVVGRFCLYSNSGIEIDNQKTIQLGGYECVDDLEVSEALIFQAKLIAKELGGKILIGPMDGSTWHNYRFTINQDKDFFFLEHIHQLYYPKQFVNNGFEELATYASFQDPEIKLNPERLKKYELRFASSGYKIRPIDLSNFESDLKQICKFSNESFKNNFLFGAKSEDDFIALFWSLKDLIESKLFWLCEDENQDVQAVLFCMPDYLDENKDTIIVKTIAKLDKPDLNGIVSYLSEHIYINALNLGYTKAIHAYFKETNKSKVLSRKYNGGNYKSHHLYQMVL